jgi:hypothetical protein
VPETPSTWPLALQVGSVSQDCHKLNT